MEELLVNEEQSSIDNTMPIFKRHVDHGKAKNNKNRISLCMNDQDIVVHKQHIVLDKPTSLLMEMDSTKHSTNSNTISVLMDRDIQKALWTKDPLRLNLDLVDDRKDDILNKQVEDENPSPCFPFADLEELPYRSKLDSKQFAENLLSTLHVLVEYDHLTLALPFSINTATDTDVTEAPPTPPPKELYFSPTLSPPQPPPLLPPKIFTFSQEPFLDSTRPWSADITTTNWPYNAREDCDRSTLMTSSPRLSTTAGSFAFSSFFAANNNNLEGEITPLTEESWEAIFHPLSTFKHNKGQLEYYAWNPSNLPLAASRVAQRVAHTLAHGQDESVSLRTPTDPDLAEATLPRLMSTPPLKPSPVLTIYYDSTSNGDVDNNDSQDTLVAREDQGQHYYDMLQKIRGGTSSSREPSLTSTLLEDAVLSDSASETVGMETLKTGSITPSSKFFNILPFSHSKEKKQHLQLPQMMDPETLMLENHPARYWTEKRLFWLGFACPLVWIYVGLTIKKTNDPVHAKWLKRCRLASMYFTVIMAIITLVATVRSAGAAATRQSQSDTIRAVIAN